MRASNVKTQLGGITHAPMAGPAAPAPTSAAGLSSDPLMAPAAGSEDESEEEQGDEYIPDSDEERAAWEHEAEIMKFAEEF